MRHVFPKLSVSFGQQIFLLASLPLILAGLAIAILVAHQSREMSEKEIRSLETQLIEAKKQELRNYVTQARNGFYYIYGNATPYDEDAKRKVMQTLAAMTYGDEGFFFIYDYDGTNLVSPRQTDLINQNLIDLQDENGTYVIRDFIQTGRRGAGYVEHLWPKPSTGRDAEMITYVTALPSWQWVIGTGVFIDDVLVSVANSRAIVEDRVRRTFVYIGVITLAALLIVFLSGLAINIHQRRLADAKLKQLTQRVFDAQEEERGRVARELHDGISQLLVGVKYALDIARRRFDTGDTRATDSLSKGIDNLSTAIAEVRRISRDLRPGVLDDLGLGPALQALADDFTTNTGIETRFETVVFRNRLTQEAKIALYRIAQEALTNIHRHAQASRVDINLRGHRHGASLTIADNGIANDVPRRKGHSGIGMRNMQERMEQLGGRLKLSCAKPGLIVRAEVPLTQLLPPEDQQGRAPTRISPTMQSSLKSETNT